MGLFDFMFESADSSQRYQWRVVKLDGPIVDQIKLNAQYGVIISSDEMLVKTQTLLFCPLISGLDEQGRLLAKLPWHIEISLEEKHNQASIPFSRKLLSTKIVLPISLNEIDHDGLQRGHLSGESRREAARMLRKWLPIR